MEETGSIADTFEQVATRYEDFYPIYKEQLREPFIRINRGYRGVVMKDKFDGKIMCNDCGITFKKLGPHVIAEHDYEDLAAYKERNGLAQYIPLVTTEMSAVSRNNASKVNLKRIGSKYRTSGKGKPKNHKYTVNPTSKRNTSGTCSPEQLRQRLVVVSNIVGRTPYYKDLRRYDASLAVLLRNAYGNLNNGMQKLGFEYKKMDTHKYSMESLIAILRKIVIEERRMPSPHKDFGTKGTVSLNTFTRFFGSWRRAKMMAGLDQLLAEVKTSRV